MQHSPPVIELKNVSKEFSLGKNVVQALKKINFEINAGEYVILFGPSGCGKSTLLNVIAGLEPPTEGKVLIRGENLTHLSMSELARHRREKIGIVFQQFNLLRSMNIVNNVALPQIFRGVKRSTRMKRAKELLRELGLKEYYNHKPSEMSGGQQQRVAIARALANNPWILLADEPTGNVDSVTAEEIMTIFRDLNRNSKRTVLLVTHNPDYLHYADRVLYIRDGTVVKETRQERSHQEIIGIQRERRAHKLAREYTRKELEEQARKAGIQPEDYSTEVELARAILEHQGFAVSAIDTSAKEVYLRAEGEAEKKTQEKIAPASMDISREARALARKMKRSELDAEARKLGIDPQKYRKEADLAAAILERQRQ